MSGKIFITICALLFVQLASARHVRDAPAAPESNPLTELLNKAGEALKEVQGKVFEAVGVKNQEEFNQYLEKETKVYANKLDTFAQELKKATEEGVGKIENSEAVQQLKTRVDEAIDGLKKENPEVSKNFDQLTQTTKSLIEGISKIGDSEGAKQIKEIGNKILETTVDALKEVNNKIQETNKS